MTEQEINDLIGITFNFLTINKLHEYRKNTPYLECSCICGKTHIASLYDIKRGHTKSCGCLNAIMSSERLINHGYCKRGNRKPEFDSWSNMKKRCYYSKDIGYYRYGGRGIKVCDRWLNSFENFISDMGDRPSKYHSLGRIDNDKNYTPENCRWETDEQQRRNRSDNVWLEYKGIKMITEDWARELNYRSGYIRARLKKGQSFEYIVNSLKK